MLYRPCTASLAREADKLGDLSILTTNRKDVSEPYWQDEPDWVCTVEFLLMTQRLGFLPRTSSATYAPIILVYEVNHR
jgi:hypothetical protein